jgi:hypothetical protein
LIWFGYDVSKAKAAQAQRARNAMEKEKMRAQFEQGIV